MQQMQIGILDRRQHFIALTECDVTALVVFHNLRFDMFSARIWRRIHVGDKTNGGHWIINIRFQFGHHIAMLIQRYITQA
ncbi:hypothetical protein VMA_001239 [Vibrio mimicus VM223]|nr:hypothetical protein VMA_001239 [Vibrio mimicus VM223]